MPRFFNTAGPCNPERHYMLPAGERLPLVEPLVEQEQYFVVHAARQSGKTTALLALARQLTAGGKYAALLASCERGQTGGADVAAGVMGVIRSIEDRAYDQLPEPLRPPALDHAAVEPESRLAHLLSRWCRACPLPVVLFLDEIDALRDESLISVLRQLRESFAARPAGFPQSVGLIGLRDVRDYKVRSAVRPEGISLGTASPFNIKSDSLTLSNFTAAEVSALLAQHTAETGQPFAPDAAAEVFEQSQGQPWLVNALAGLCTTRPDALVPDRTQVVTREHVLQVREILIERRDTHLDSLVDKLREPRVQRVIEPILAGQTLPLDLEYDDDLAHARDLGLVARRDGLLRIANPIYQEIIPRVLTARLQESIAVEPAWYLRPDGTLDLPKLIDGFVAFWRRHGEVLLKGMPYQEAAPHLVFMAYLQRIVNGGGRIEREYAIGAGRADLVVELAGRQDVIELKLLRDSGTLPEGLEQVARYARRLGRDRGYLVLFDRGSTLPWEEHGTVEEVVQDGVTVVVVRA